MRQFDLKVIVAYSSIAHMSSSLLGTFSDNVSGVGGSIVFGLGHGFVSPGLFILVGAVLYDKCGSRIINYFKGLTYFNPLFITIFLLFVFGNMGVPLTGNFIGEFLSLLGAYQQNIFVASIGATSVVLSAIYSIYLFNRVGSGSTSPHIFTIPDMYRKEFYILVPLLVLTIILGVYPSFITSDIEFALSHCLLFAISPVVFINNKNEGEIQKLHETNSNPHNTPVVNNVLPASSSRNTNTENNNINQSNPVNVGNPNSEEGSTPFVGLDDRRNQGINSNDLKDRIEVIISDKDKNLENISSESNELENGQNGLQELNTSKDSDVDLENNISDYTEKSKSSDKLPNSSSEPSSSSRPRSSNSDIPNESNIDNANEESDNEYNVSHNDVPHKRTYGPPSEPSESEFYPSDSDSINTEDFMERQRE